MAENPVDTTLTFSDHVVAFETALKQAGPEEWYPAAISVINSVFRGPWIPGLTELGVDQPTCEHWYTRLAAALTIYISHPATDLTLAQVAEVSRKKQIIAYIFNASGYRNMRHLLSLMGTQHGEDITIPSNKLAIYYAFTGLDDINDELMDIALKQQPTTLLLLMLGWLNQRAVLTEQGEANRGKLLRAGSLIETADVGDQNIEQIINAWMYSSYATEPAKHSIKKSLNVLLRNLISAGNIVPRPVTHTIKKRPTIFVIHERFTSYHAMFRCYAPYLMSLKKNFRLIALCESQHIDEGADDIFDEVIKLDDGQKKISELVALVQSHEPDMVYYPSLGMSHWTVMLAQLRLAPVQIMTHGHPATSMSPEIDYVYVCDLDGDLAALHSERILVGSEYGTFAPYAGSAELPKLIEASSREVRVAVNSKVMKLSHRLLDICTKLSENAAVPVRFSFFPGERGLFYDGLAPAIRAQVPDATIEPYMDYEEFLTKMCRCDLALAAFPFGNTNSTVDTCLLGLPTVVHFGPESPAQTDRMVLKTAGFPDWLVAHSDEEYYEKALTLINDVNRRSQLTAGITREKVRARLYDLEECDRASDPFADMFWYAYNNHASIQSSDQRVFHYKNVLKKSAL